MQGPDSWDVAHPKPELKCTPILRQNHITSGGYRSYLYQPKKKELHNPGFADADIGNLMSQYNIPITQHAIVISLILYP